MVGLFPIPRYCGTQWLVYLCAKPFYTILSTQPDEIISATSSEHFVNRTLAKLDVKIDISSRDLNRIPSNGPLVVLANHPFGIVDPLCLISLLLKKRTDLKVITNHLLSVIPEVAPICIFVDPFGGRNTTNANLSAMKEAVRWLRSGGAIAVFPAGEVSSLVLPRLNIVEKQWTEHIARLIKIGRASTLPIYFHGTNSPMFHLGGLVHPAIRTALLPNELLNKKGAVICVAVGYPIPFSRTSTIKGDRELVEHLRQRTFLLRHRIKGSTLQIAPTLISPAQIVAPALPELLTAEIASLPTKNHLLSIGEFEVCFAEASQIPNLLQEIGRLREITFRAVGEGTGKSTDLDIFDDYYLHLFVWHHRKNELLGAYRLGRTDKIIERYGINGLYTSTLFDYRPILRDFLNPALELGRSWVRREYQRSSIALPILWKGIGAYVVEHPQYSRLFGPVSISNDYQSVSHQLIVQYLRKNHSCDGLSKHIRAKNPFIRRLPKDLKNRWKIDNIDDLSSIVADLEPDGKGVPILVKEYLKMGGKVLALNVDREFGNVVDALIVVDLCETEKRRLERHLGEAGAIKFLGIG